MSFDRGRIERQHDGIFAGLGQGFKDYAPSSALGPTIEAIVDRRVRPVFRWTIAPSRTRLQHVNDAADDATIIVPIRSGQSRRQVRFYPRPLLIVQPKQAATHLSSPNQNMRTRESRGANQVQTLVLLCCLSRRRCFHHFRYWMGLRSRAVAQPDRALARFDRPG